MKAIKFLFVAFYAAAALPAAAQRATPLYPESVVKSRYRVIVDNDFGGDPDGLFQLAHQLLSPSTEVKGIIGSHLRKGDPFDSSDQTATNAVKTVEELLKAMKLSGAYPIYQGSNSALTDMETPQNSAAADAIIKEALSEDKRPLFVVCGAGLTDVASAYLKNPEIAKRLTVVWIGGPEYPTLATPPPGYTSLEYNLNIDINAVRVVFNKSDLNIWQVPRNAYRQPLMAYSELLTKVKPQGATGAYLAGKIEGLMQRLASMDFPSGETYIMGDSPLVLLTALQSSFEADPSSSDYVLMPSPLVNEQGLYETNHKGRNIRVYTKLDTRLLFEDFYNKLALFNQPKSKK